MCLKHLGIKQVDNIKSLGIELHKSSNFTAERNLNNKLIKIENLLNMWKARNLTIKGKITLIKSKVIPLLIYVASVFYVSDDHINNLDKLLYSFIWPSGKHHVKKDLLIQTIDNGGLNMPDAASVIKSVKLSWIKRLLKANTNYHLIAQTMARIDDFNDFFSHNNSTELLINKPSKFYKQIIDLH